MRLSLPTRPGDLPISAAQAAAQHGQLALWPSGEGVREWHATSDRVRVDVAAGAEMPFTGTRQGMCREQDVTAQRDAEQSRRLMAHAFSSTRAAMAVIDPPWQVLETNEALVRLAGDDSGIMPGSHLRPWQAPDGGVLPQVQADGIWRAQLALRLHALDSSVPVAPGCSAWPWSTG